MYSSVYSLSIHLTIENKNILFNTIKKMPDKNIRAIRQPKKNKIAAGAHCNNVFKIIN